jgi:hypothetical protein
MHNLQATTVAANNLMETVACSVSWDKNGTPLPIMVMTVWFKFGS